MLNFIALLTALSISGVAAYYSIYGLTAIFSGVFWPIVIMGSVLEVGKIVITVWLHTYWAQLKWLLKSYMSLSVMVLMFITSMGIFGFLSRAHIEVTSQAGGGELLIQQVELNMSTEQKRIDDARAVMKQMDDAVTALLKGSGANAERDNNRTAAMTTQATKLRESQKKERDSLNKSIDESSKRIADLSKEKLKLKQEDLKMQAEVGPIKYIAQLIYDDELPGQNMLEKAVRWVIIIIVAVFDPLAVALVLGVTMVMNSDRKQREQDSKKKRDEHGNRDIELPTGVVREVERIVEVPIEVIREIEIEKLVEVPVDRVVVEYVQVEKEVIREVEVERIVEVQVPGPVEYVDRIVTQAVPIMQEKIVEVIREVEKPVEVIKEVTVLVADTAEIQRLEEELAETLIMLEEARNTPADVVEKIVERIVEKTIEVPVQDTYRMFELTKELDSLLKENENKDNLIHQLRAQVSLKQEELEGIDISEFDANLSTSLLGRLLPDAANAGDLFYNTAEHQLYKYNGLNWMQADKNNNTSYTYDEHWQHFMMGALTRGELEWDDLSSAEQTALETPGRNA